MSSSGTFDDLITKLHQEISNAKNNLNGLGSIKVKLSSLTNLINKANLDDKQRVFYFKKLEELNSELKNLSDERSKQKMSLHREMKESNLTVQRIDELTPSHNSYTNLNSMSDRDFYKGENSKLDSIISQGFDSLANLKKQDDLIGNINDKVKNSLRMIGVSGDFLSKIEKRTFGDKTLFYFLLAFTILMIILLRFIF